MSEARAGGPDMLLGISDTTAVDMPRCGVPGMPRPIGLNGDCVAESNLTGVPGCGGVAICNLVVNLKYNSVLLSNKGHI